MRDYTVFAGVAIAAAVALSTTRANGALPGIGALPVLPIVLATAAAGLWLLRWLHSHAVVPRRTKPVARSAMVALFGHELARKVAYSAPMERAAP